MELKLEAVARELTMSSAEKVEFISVEDYLASEMVSTCRHEYIDGWVRAMAGVSIRHNRVGVNCLMELGDKLRGKPCAPYYSELKVRVVRHGSTRFYYPDLQVVCDSNDPTDHFQDRPVLIIEVLSPSTRQYDLDEKMAAYLSIPTLQAYLILEQHQPIAIIMRRTPNGFLRETVEGVDAVIELPFLQCSIAMKSIYDGVEFTPTCVQEPEPEYESA